jgi:PAS domain S-box-containing protein
MADALARGAELRTLDALVEALPNLMWIADADGAVRYVNARWVEYTGQSAEDLSSVRGVPRGIVHPHDLERTGALKKRSLETGEAYEVTYRLRSGRDGSYRWFLARAAPVFDIGGNIVEWIGTATDIDTQVRAQASSRFFSEAAAILSSSLDLKAVMSLFARLATDLFCDGCVVLLADPDGAIEIEAVAHKDPKIEHRLRASSNAQRVIKNGAVKRVVESRQPLLIASVPELALAEASIEDDDDRRLLADLRLQSLIIVPLVVADAFLGAVVFASSDETRPYDAGDLDIANATARQAALAIENGRSLEREQKLSERLRFLARATEQLFTSLGTPVTLDGLLDIIVGDMADGAFVFTVEPGNVLRIEAAAHHEESKRPLVHALLRQRVLTPEAESRITSRLRQLRGYVRNDIDQREVASSAQPHALKSLLHLHPETAVVTPLAIGGELIGVLVAFSSGSDRTYGDGDLQLLDEIGRRASVAIEHARSLERERHIAQTLQEVTLPSKLASVPGIVLSTAYFAASTDLQVGGDWYDAFELDDGRLLLTIGDVVGHGLQASVIMGKLRHFFNVIATYESDPARILDAAERILLRRYPDAIATAFLAILDPAAQRILFANAGHPYPLARLRDGSIVELEANGLPIGLRSLSEPGQSRARGTGDVDLLTLYTDGLVEATRDIAHGEGLLRAAMSRDAVLYTHNAASFIAAYCLPARAPDDVAVLTLTMPRSALWSFDADDGRAAQAARDGFVRELRRRASDDSDFAGAELIFGELVGNVVRHAPGPVDVALEWRDERAVLHVTDRGEGFTHEPSSRVDLLREDGRGLWLVEAMGRGLRTDPLARFGNHIEVVLPVEPQT